MKIEINEIVLEIVITLVTVELECNFQSNSI